MNPNVSVSRSVDRVGLLSLVSASLTAVLAAISHAYDFGPPAFVVGALGLALLWASGLGFLRTGNRLALGVYALLNLWAIVGFGVIGGFWNHAVKMIVCAGHGGTVPSAWADWFISPDPGSAVYETVGVLTFVASIAAAVFGFGFVRRKPGRPGVASEVASAYSE